MKVSEIFHSLSGEGIHAGIPTVFVRLIGCNLRCSYCDTKYAFEGGEELTLDVVVKRVCKFKKTDWVLITGGEPLCQPEATRDLVNELKQARYLVEIETNGSIDPPSWFSLVDSWNVDVKGPSSGSACNSFREKWLTRLRKRDQLKFVADKWTDLDFACSFLKDVRVRSTILVSPMLPNSPDSLFGDVLISQRPWLQEVWNFCVKYNFRWSFQQHKIVYGNKRGV